MMNCKLEIASLVNKRPRPSNLQTMGIKQLDLCGIREIKMSSSSSQSKDILNHIHKRPLRYHSSLVRQFNTIKLS
jgi:hypothetical protein